MLQFEPRVLGRRTVNDEANRIIKAMVNDGGDALIYHAYTKENRVFI